MAREQATSSKLKFVALRATVPPCRWRSTIAGSPLVKTMFAGADPNWGRILAAAGRSGVKFDPNRTDIHMGGMLVCRHGVEHPFSERQAHQRLQREHVPVLVDLGAGTGRARVWTCDFTTDYVHINAAYRT